MTTTAQTTAAAPWVLTTAADAQQKDRVRLLGRMAGTTLPRYEISGMSPGEYWIALGRGAPDPEKWAWEKIGFYDWYSPENTPLSCVFTDKEEVQYFDFDLKTPLTK